MKTSRTTKMIYRQNLVLEPCITAVRGQCCQVPAVLKANILAKMRMGEQQILRVSEAHISTEELVSNMCWMSSAIFVGFLYASIEAPPAAGAGANFLWFAAQ